MTVRAGYGEAREAIIPAASLTELQKHLVGVEGPVRISLGDASAEVRLEGVTLRTRLIEGEFPKFRQLIPDPGTNSRVLTVGREELLEVAARVALVAGTNTPIKMALGEEVRLSAVEAGVGEADEELEGAVYEGEPMTVAFNPKFLGAALDHTEGEKVRIECANPIKPARIVGEGHDELTWIVMPVRLSR
jgi:DNA polymerase-3 subunit beta